MYLQTRNNDCVYFISSNNVLKMLSTKTSQYFCSIRLFSNHSSAEHPSGSARYRGINNKKNWNTVKKILWHPSQYRGNFSPAIGYTEVPYQPPPLFCFNFHRQGFLRKRKFGGFIDKKFGKHWPTVLTSNYSHRFTEKDLSTANLIMNKL